MRDFTSTYPKRDAIREEGGEWERLKRNSSKERVVARNKKEREKKKRKDREPIVGERSQLGARNIEPRREEIKGKTRPEVHAREMEARCSRTSTRTIRVSSERERGWLFIEWWFRAAKRSQLFSELLGQLVRRLSSPIRASHIYIERLEGSNGNNDENAAFKFLSFALFARFGETPVAPIRIYEAKLGWKMRLPHRSVPLGGTIVFR